MNTLGSIDRALSVFSYGLKTYLENEKLNKNG